MRRVQLLIDESLLKAVEEWRRKQPEIANRNEALRQLLRKALKLGSKE